MKVTMEQIANTVGVSRGTVDRALHHRGRVDAEVEARVLRAAREIGYPLDKPARAPARMLRLQASTTSSAEKYASGGSSHLPVSFGICS